MPRPLEREKPLKRVNVMLDCEALENAQRKAALAGVSPAIIGSSSAFIRWLIDEYNKSFLILHEDDVRAKLRSVPEIGLAMAQACGVAEQTLLENQSKDLKKILGKSIKLTQKHKQAILELNKAKKGKK